MDRRFARRLVLGAWLMLAGLLPLAAQAQSPAPDAQAALLAPAAAPACARWSATHIDCFVIGSDGRLWLIAWDATSQWGGWRSVPQPPATIDPLGGLAVVMRGSEVDIFVVGIDGGFGNLYRLTWTGIGWTAWSNLGRPGASNIYEVACASTAANNLECFARVSDNHLWHKSWNGASWGAWTDRGAFPSPAGLGGLAAATWSGSNLVVYAIGGDGRAYRLVYFSGTWGTWQDDGKPAAGELRQVGCAARDTATIECAFTDINGGTWYRRWTNSGGWEPFANLGAPPSYARGVTVANYGEDAVVVLSNASDGRFYRTFRDPGADTWSQWYDLGRPKDVRVFIPQLIRQ
ncbi:MAG TPA: hypothetical protein VD886_06695 [Herpetosiphonaceae bacterium]|nr:hypothetical protein [Herpetosiphonaceae bacterium]